MENDSIGQFNDAQDAEARPVCALLRRHIDRHLSDAAAKIWHAHPVWFLGNNPIVGYSRLKDGVRLMFWSGQGFATPGLSPVGKFKAAGIRFTDVAQVDGEQLAQWLDEARVIQWDYGNIVKRRGDLERLF